MESFIWLNEFAQTSNEFTTNNKSEEEIKRLTLEEDLNEIKRSLQILTKGQQIQKYAIYSNLKRIFLESGAFEKFALVLQSDIMNQTEENQIEAARSISKLINTNELPQDKLIVLYRLTLSVLKLWNQAVLNAWVTLFNELLYKIQFESVEKETLFLVNNLSESSQHVFSKYVAARMIGFIAERFKNRFGGSLPDRALSLCLDIDVEVRKIMVQEVLLKVTFALGSEFAETKVLDKVIELIYDTEMQVKLASLDVLLEISDLLSYDCKKNRVTGTLLDFCSTNNEEIIRKMSFQIGKICYKDSAFHRSPEIRKNFVHNLPAMIEFFETKDQLRQIFAKLFKDPCKEVKIKCIGCFLEVCKIFIAVDLGKNLREVYESLLREEDLDVLAKFAPLLAETTAIFQEIKTSELECPSKELKEPKDKEAKDLSFSQSSDIKSYLEAVIAIGNVLSKHHNWRLEVKFLEGFPIYYEIFDIKELNEKLVPYLIKRIKEGINEIRLKALEMLVRFMRINYLNAKFKELIKLVLDEFAYSSCYQMRITYINLFLKFGEVFSRNFIKQNLLGPLFLQKLDKTVQVRRKLASQLAEIRGLLLPDDTENIKKFTELVKRLSQDLDKEVSSKAKNFQEVLLEPIPFCEESEKASVEEEEELRSRESKEIEEQKQRNSLPGKLDFVQNYGNFYGGSDNRRQSYKAVKTNPKKVLENFKQRHSLLLGSQLGTKATVNTGPVRKLSGKSNTDASPQSGGIKMGFSGKVAIDSSPIITAGKSSKPQSLNSLDSNIGRVQPKRHTISHPISTGSIPEKNSDGQDKISKNLNEVGKTEMKPSKRKELYPITLTNSGVVQTHERKGSLKLK